MCGRVFQSTRCRLPVSPMAFIPRHGWRRNLPRFIASTWAIGRNISPNRSFGAASSTFPTLNSGKHQQLKRRLVDFVRDRERQRRERLGESPESIRRVNRILDPEILTVGFARRFATYKRGALLFSDKERLKRLVNDATRPVQFIFAGKAHPRDEAGKALIQEVYKFSREPGLETRVIFVEDYDSYIARRLVQGVDLWLNHPLRPLEASGTSGMKASPNGGINLSVLDGWWREGYNGSNGWAIGAEIDNGTTEFQNEVDASSLYQLLENQIVPLYYAKPDGKLPLAWLQLMRESIRSVTPVFNTQRMVKEYTEKIYIPAAKAQENFSRGSCGAAKHLSQWKTQMRKDWPQVQVSDVQVANKDRQSISVGESLLISARVHLGGVDPQHVRVERTMARWTTAIFTILPRRC